MIGAPVRIYVPRLGVNEDEVLLAGWAIEDGARVEEGALLCTVETSKASSDVHADAAGWIHVRVPAGERVAVRSEIAVILPEPDATPPPLEARAEAEVTGVQRSSKSASRGGRRAAAVAEALGVEADGGTSEVIRRARRLDAAPLAIYGAALGGRVIAEYLELVGRWRAVAYLDDADDLPEEIDGIPVRPGSDLGGLLEEGIAHVFVAIGLGRVRLAVMDRVEEAGLTLPTLVHPAAYVAPSAALGRGALVKAGATVGTSVRVGPGSIIDNGAVVPHDNTIGAGALIAPGAALGSGIVVGDRAVVGIGARVATAVHIGADAVVATGAAVVRDVAPGDVVEGAPARVVGRVRLP